MKKRHETWWQITIIILAYFLSTFIVVGVLLGHGRPEYLLSGALGGLVVVVTRRVLRGGWWY